jgi:ABC-type anion transport system duplicated permease subunit
VIISLTTLTNLSLSWRRAIFFAVGTEILSIIQTSVFSIGLMSLILRVAAQLGEVLHEKHA